MTLFGIALPSILRNPMIPMLQLVKDVKDAIIMI
jgi:hypothetical protein